MGAPAIGRAKNSARMGRDQLFRLFAPVLSRAVPFGIYLWCETIKNVGLRGF
jgi:hypothetical protein